MRSAINLSVGDIAPIAVGIALGVAIAILPNSGLPDVADGGESDNRSIDEIETQRKRLESETEQMASALATRESTDQTPFYEREEVWLSVEVLSRVKMPTFSEWNGSLDPALAELLGLTETETAEVETLVLGAREDLKSLEEEMAKKKPSADGTLEMVIPPFPDEGKLLSSRLFGELSDLVGHNRASILLHFSDRVLGNFGQLTQTISMRPLPREGNLPQHWNVRIARHDKRSLVNSSEGPIPKAIFVDRYGHLMGKSDE